MLIWWLMAICDLVTPILMLTAGALLWRKPPKRINSIFGYRTERSMKSPEAWRFANEFCGRLWVKCGAFMLPLTLAALIPLLWANEITVSVVGCILMLLQLLVLVFSIAPTEKALRQGFDDDGKPKDIEA